MTWIIIIIIFRAEIFSITFPNYLGHFVSEMSLSQEYILTLSEEIQANHVRTYIFPLKYGIIVSRLKCVIGYVIFFH